MFDEPDDQSLTYIIPFPESHEPSEPLHGKIERHLAILLELVEQSGLQNSRFSLLSFIENYRHELQMFSGEIVQSACDATPQQIHDFNRECERIVHDREYKHVTRNCIQYDDRDIRADVELLAPDWPDSQGDIELEQVIRDVCLTPEGVAYLEGMDAFNKRAIREALEVARENLATQRILDTNIVFA